MSLYRTVRLARSCLAPTSQPEAVPITPAKAFIRPRLVNVDRGRSEASPRSLSKSSREALFDRARSIASPSSKSSHGGLDQHDGAALEVERLSDRISHVLQNLIDDDSVSLAHLETFGKRIASDIFKRSK